MACQSRHVAGGIRDTLTKQVDGLPREPAEERHEPAGEADRDRKAGRGAP